MSALDRILHIVQTLYTSNDILFGIEEAKVELSDLRARITELEADALARLIEEPTNERIMKDVYEENERLQKVNYILVDAVKVALQVWGSAMYPQTTAILESAIKEYGGKE